MAWQVTFLIAGAWGARILERDEALPLGLRRLRDAEVLTEHQAHAALRYSVHVPDLAEVLGECRRLALDPAPLAGALAEEEFDEDAALDHTLLDAAPCFMANLKYMPANMHNQSRSREDNVLHCQQRCLRTAGCAHFSFWPDHGCHLQSMEAKRTHATRVTSGPPDCRERNRMQACFRENTKPVPANMEGQRRTQEDSVLACQRRCQDTAGCEHFAYWPNGGCHLQAGNVTFASARGVISGPSICMVSHPLPTPDQEGSFHLDELDAMIDVHTEDADLSDPEDDEPQEDALGVTLALVPRQRGVAMVLEAAQLVAKDLMKLEEFEREVGTCEITAAKEAEFQQLLQMFKFLRRDHCGEEDPCLSDTAWESQVLSRFAVMQKLKAEANVSSQHGACCPLPMEQLLTKGKLVEVAKEEELPRNPLMMYQAATRSCNNQTQQQQQFVAVFRRCGEAGYCCEARDLQWRLHPLNEDLAEDSLVQLVKMTENLQVEAEWIYRRLLRKMEEWKWVPREQKTMFYKMYIIYYHQVRMAMDRQKYCLFSPEDLDACEDPISLYVSVKKVRNEIHQTYRALRELGSCLQTGTKTLGAVKGKWPGKAIGVLGLLLRRAVHVLGTGQIQVRVHQLAGSLLRTAWQNRFEIILASLVVGAGQPLMMALTATGVSTGAATSWTLILEQFMRNFFVHVGCPILSSPMLMAMLVRWSMNKILLTDFFIDNVVGPLWEMAKKTLGPLAVLPQTLGVSLDVVKAVLRAVKGALGGNSTQDTRESWLEAARAFHATAAADLLYGFFSVTFGVMWRAVATAACTAARLALPVINGAEAGMDAGLQSFAKTWEGLARRASQGLKRGLQDETAKRVAQMAAEDRQVAEASRGIPSKTLALVHKMLGKGSVALASGADKSLSVFEKLLDMIGQSTIFVYGISSALSFLVLRVWQPSQEVVTDELLLASLGERLEDFNAYSCQGRQEGRDCALLRFGGLSNETVSTGVCCRGSCSAQCEAESPDADPDVAEAAASAAAAMSLVDLRRQSKFLYGFINLARKSYGSVCAE